MRKLLILIGISLLLAGCERSPPAARQMDNYLERLGRVLDQDHQEYNVEELSKYRLPERRERLIDIEPMRISLIKLLVDTRRCKPLQQRVSERNSILGKVMPWSHRLAFEGELIRAIEDCAVILSDDPDREDLIAELEQLAADKRAQLPAVFWNALNASEEFEYYLRFAAEPLPVQEQALEDRRGALALSELADTGLGLPDQLPPPLPELEAHFQSLHQSERSSQLIHSLSRMTHTLEQATNMLSSSAARQLCPMGQPTSRSRILLNVFVLFYAGEIQPYMAQIQRLGQPWQQNISQLKAVPAIPPATANYLGSLAGEDNALWLRYQRQLTAHSEAWQEVLGACQMRPGQSGWQSTAEG
ncbi:DUF3080 family protein [uncultured Halopseudomonas sp.]|uniref:DUF3080 family protein n=1 Tax=uncultured Halopseudomonas sp. TaxID=2901193 RepID=UPI0030EE5353